MTFSTIEIPVEVLMANMVSPTEKSLVLPVWTHILSVLKRNSILLKSPTVITGEEGFIEELTWVMTENDLEIGELQFTYKKRFDSKKFHIIPYEDDEENYLISPKFLRDNLNISTKQLNLLVA